MYITCSCGGCWHHITEPAAVDGGFASGPENRKVRPMTKRAHTTTHTDMRPLTYIGYMICDLLLCCHMARCQNVRVPIKDRSQVAQPGLSPGYIMLVKVLILSRNGARCEARAVVLRHIHP
jgi:hypothetical protein